MDDLRFGARQGQAIFPFSEKSRLVVSHSPTFPFGKKGVLSPGVKRPGALNLISHIQVVPMYWHWPRSLQLSLAAVRAGEIDSPLFLTS